MKKTVARVSHEAVVDELRRDRLFEDAHQRLRLVSELAMAVRAMRESAGFTQAQLAARIGVTQPVIGRLERGLEQRRPRFDLLQRIGFALGKLLKFVFLSSNAEEPLVEVRSTKPARGVRGASVARGAASP